jgi:hypothetical protein
MSNIVLLLVLLQSSRLDKKKYCVKKMAVFWDVAPCSSDSHLHTRRRENLKSHNIVLSTVGPATFVTLPASL